MILTMLFVVLGGFNKIRRHTNVYHRNERRRSNQLPDYIYRLELTEVTALGDMFAQYMDLSTGKIYDSEKFYEMRQIEMEEILK